MEEDAFDTSTPLLPKLRELAYAVYTRDGNPTQVNVAKPPNHTIAHYVVAESENLPLRSPSLDSPLSTFATQLCRDYRNTAGFFRIEHGVTQAGGHLPIEAMQLLHYSAWPIEKRIAYCSQFAPHPLLARELKIKVLQQLFASASRFAIREQVEDHMYVIMSQPVYDFVTEAGIQTEFLPGARLNEDNPLAVEVFDTFPKYWRQGDPQLYRFIPHPEPF
jgi:hypothetical protein